MENNPIQAALEEIAQEAAAKTAAINLQRDDYLKALELVKQLKAVGGPALDSLTVSLCFYSTKQVYGLNIYANNSNPAALHYALLGLGATITKRDYDDVEELWTLHDYPGLQIFMPKSALPAVAEAA